MRIETAWVRTIDGLMVLRSSCPKYSTIPIYLPGSTTTDQRSRSDTPLLVRVLCCVVITQSTDDPKRSSAHVNALFTHEVIFPMGVRRCMGPGCGTYVPKETSLETTYKANIAAVVAQGGIAQVNHPNYR